MTTLKQQCGGDPVLVEDYFYANVRHYLKRQSLPKVDWDFDNCMFLFDGGPQAVLVFATPYYDGIDGIPVEVYDETQENVLDQDMIEVDMELWTGDPAHDTFLFYGIVFGWAQAKRYKQ